MKFTITKKLLIKEPEWVLRIELAPETKEELIALQKFPFSVAGSPEHTFINNYLSLTDFDGFNVLRINNYRSNTFNVVACKF